MRLENKVALITGGASGMGASMARIFAREGAKVVVADMLEEGGRAVADEITRANGAAIFQKLDVSSEAEWRAAIAATLAAYGKLDILVNDAGISGSREEDLFDSAAWEKIMAVNSTGTFLGSGTLPLCEKCDGIVKTATISFGQAMPEIQMARAQDETLQCDLFIVLGSSLVVYPAAGFPEVAKRNGATLVIVNREETQLDRLADLVIHRAIGDTLGGAVGVN